MCNGFLDHIDTETPDCRCDNCGATLPHTRAYYGCVCEVCGTEMHSYEHHPCECDFCDHERHEDVDWDGAGKCDGCGLHVRHVDIDAPGGNMICDVCGETITFDEDDFIRPGQGKDNKE